MRLAECFPGLDPEIASTLKFLGLPHEPAGARRVHENRVVGDEIDQRFEWKDCAPGIESFTLVQSTSPSRFGNGPKEVETVRRFAQLGMEAALGRVGMHAQVFDRDELHGYAYMRPTAATVVERAESLPAYGLKLVAGGWPYGLGLVKHLVQGEIPVAVAGPDADGQALRDERHDMENHIIALMIIAKSRMLSEGLQLEAGMLLEAFEAARPPEALKVSDPAAYEAQLEEALQSINRFGGAFDEFALNSAFADVCEGKMRSIEIAAGKVLPRLDLETVMKAIKQTVGNYDRVW